MCVFAEYFSLGACGRAGGRVLVYVLSIGPVFLIGFLDVSMRNIWSILPRFLDVRIQIGILYQSPPMVVYLERH